MGINSNFPTGTLLFVSHDIGAVQNLCQATIWLESGRVKMFGDTKKVTNAYVHSELQDANQVAGRTESFENEKAGNSKQRHFEGLPNENTADSATEIHFFENLQDSTCWKTGVAAIESVCFLDENDNALSVLAGGEDVCLAIRVRANKEIVSPIVGFFIKDRLGQPLFGENTFRYISQPLRLMPGQVCESRFYFRIPLLPNGDYAATVAIDEGTPTKHVQHHWVHDAVVFKVVSNKHRFGLVAIPYKSITMKVLESH